MKIFLHIDRLVLDGVPLASADQEALRHAFSTRLSTLLAAGLHRDLLSGGARPAVRGGTITIGGETGGARLGGELARAVHGGIGADNP